MKRSLIIAALLLKFVLLAHAADKTQPRLQFTVVKAAFH
jgi:hypothetical protein